MELKEYDSSRLREIAGDDESFIIDILQTFVSSLINEIDSVKTATKNKDWPALQFTVHRLRSSAGSIGADNTMISCRLIEDYIKTNKLVESEINKLVENFLLSSAFDLSEIKKELTKLGANSF